MFFRTIKFQFVLATSILMVAVAVSTWLWMNSQSAWERHLGRAFELGVALHDSLVLGSATPPELRVEFVEADLSSNLAVKIKAEELGFSPTAKVTTAVLQSLHSAAQEVSTPLSGREFVLHILSDDLQYPISKLEGGQTGFPSLNLGAISRLIASYCSHPIMLAKINSDQWYKISAPDVWQCEATPADRRWHAVIIFVLSILAFLTVVSGSIMQFEAFAEKLRERLHSGHNTQFDEVGPVELQDTIHSLNQYLLNEKDRIEKRAAVLSGVSHDLGTPATRLKLRAALIEDEDLREKLSADIDQMTEMIDSALAYTRTEQDNEEFRQISLTSLLEAIVADYQDVGKNVSLAPFEGGMVRIWGE